jgi:hypothetical protein
MVIVYLLVYQNKSNYYHKFNYIFYQYFSKYYQSMRLFNYNNHLLIYFEVIFKAVMFKSLELLFLQPFIPFLVKFSFLHIPLLFLGQVEASKLFFHVFYLSLIVPLILIFILMLDLSLGVLLPILLIIIYLVIPILLHVNGKQEYNFPKHSLKS